MTENKDLQIHVENNIFQILNHHNIPYTMSNDGRLQVVTDDLLQLQRLQDDLELPVSSLASAIFRVEPNAAFTLSKMFPSVQWEHQTKIKGDKKKDTSHTKRYIIVRDLLLTGPLYAQLSDTIGLRLHHYEHIVHVNPAVINRFKIHKGGYRLPTPDFDNAEIHIFADYKSINSQASSYIDEEFEVTLSRRNLTHILNKTFGKGNYTIENRFFYHYDFFKYKNSAMAQENKHIEAFQEYLHSVLDATGITVSHDRTLIGIDFNWRDETLVDIIQEVANLCKFADISYYKSHKCNLRLAV